MNILPEMSRNIDGLWEKWIEWGQDLLKSDSEGGEGTHKIKLSRILSLVDF